MEKTTYNYFKRRAKSDKKRANNVVKYRNFEFVCDSANQADLLRRWIKAGDNFKVKG